MTEDTVRMLKTMKQCFIQNASTAKKNRDWLEEEHWKTFVESIQCIEKYENLEL
jgi:hypothetical protein